jgi:hypothetical protein
LKSIERQTTEMKNELTEKIDVESIRKDLFEEVRKQIAEFEV